MSDTDTDADTETETPRWGWTPNDTDHQSRVHGDSALFDSVWLFDRPADTEHFHADPECNRRRETLREATHSEIDHQCLRPCSRCHDDEWVVTGCANTSDTFHTESCGDWPAPASRIWIRMVDIQKRRRRQCQRCSGQYDASATRGRASDCPLCDDFDGGQLVRHIQRDHGSGGGDDE
jgi:hypothetical protein